MDMPFCEVTEVNLLTASSQIVKLSAIITQCQCARIKLIKFLSSTHSSNKIVNCDIMCDIMINIYNEILRARARVASAVILPKGASGSAALTASHSTQLSLLRLHAECSYCKFKSVRILCRSYIYACIRLYVYIYIYLS